MGSLLLSPLDQATDDSGNVLSGAKLYVYLAGTTTAASVYSDIALSSAVIFPVVSDAAGRFINLYVDGGASYKLLLQDSTGSEVLTSDNVPPAITNASGVIPITSGGTNAATPAAVLTSIGAASASSLSTLSSSVATISNAQAIADWETGTATAETVVSPAKIKASIDANQATQSGVPDAEMWHGVASGASGDTLTASSWQTRTLNEEYDPNNLVSISSNAFTPTKDGYVEWSAPCRSTDVASGRAHRTRLYCVTDSSVVSVSPTAGLESQAYGVSLGSARVEASKAYRIEHFPTGTASSGIAVNTGDDEIYTFVKFFSNHNS